MGVRTQLAGLAAAGSIVLILLFLTDPISYLPKAVLGAVIVAAAIGLVDPKAWRALWATDRVELTIAAVTTAGVVAVGVLEALVFAVGLSIVDVVRRSAPRTTRCSAGWTSSAATATSPCTARRGSLRAWSSTASTTGSSSPTPATSRAACSRPCAARPRRGTRRVRRRGRDARGRHGARGARGPGDRLRKEGIGSRSRARRRRCSPGSPRAASPPDGVSPDGAGGGGGGRPDRRHSSGASSAARR